VDRGISIDRDARQGTITPLTGRAIRAGAPVWRWPFHHPRGRLRRSGCGERRSQHGELPGAPRSACPAACPLRSRGSQSRWSTEDPVLVRRAGGV